MATIYHVAACESRTFLQVHNLATNKVEIHTIVLLPISQEQFIKMKHTIGARFTIENEPAEFGVVITKYTITESWIMSLDLQTLYQYIEMRDLFHGGKQTAWAGLLTRLANFMNLQV